MRHQHMHNSIRWRDIKPPHASSLHKTHLSNFEWTCQRAPSAPPLPEAFPPPLGNGAESSPSLSRLAGRESRTQLTPTTSNLKWRSIAPVLPHAATFFAFPFSLGKTPRKLNKYSDNSNCHRHVSLHDLLRYWEGKTGNIQSFSYCRSGVENRR